MVPQFQRDWPGDESPLALQPPQRSACPALQFGILLPYNRSGLAQSVERRPSLPDGILLPRLHRSAAPPILTLVPHRQHTRLLGGADSNESVRTAWYLGKSPPPLSICVSLRRPKWHPPG